MELALKYALIDKGNTPYHIFFIHALLPIIENEYIQA